MMKTVEHSITKLTPINKPVATESAVLVGVVPDALGTMVAAGYVNAKRVSRNLRKALEKYEHMHPDIPTFSSLSEEEVYQEHVNVKESDPKVIYSGRTAITEYDIWVDQFSDSSGRILFTVTYKTIGTKDYTIDGMNYDPKDAIGRVHKDYYQSAWWEPRKSIDIVLSPWIRKILHAKESENVTEAYHPGLFSDDNIIKAGLIAGTAGQIGSMAMSKEEKKYRVELGQIQAFLDGNPVNMTTDQKVLMASRAGIVLNELAKLERRKGTAKAIRNAALMVAASAQIHKMYVNGRNNGPDNPEMISLIGGIPELL